MTSITLRNNDQSATFAQLDDTGSYRPEWFRLGDRPMLRFKDHEWLNISTIRVTGGQLKSHSEGRLDFGGVVDLAGEPVAWSVTVCIPPDGGSGFLVKTKFEPTSESIEIIEGLSTFELPYEYDGSEETMTVMAQQPVYRFRGGEQIDGCSYNHPNWYYGRVGATHLTFPSSSPLFSQRVAAADGTNERCIQILANWNHCSFKDMFAVPTRNQREEDSNIFPDSLLLTGTGRRGVKYLIGAANWNISLYKDPNYVVDPGAGVSQELIVDYRNSLDNYRWDLLLAGGWERLAAMNYPVDGNVPAYDLALAQGASWVDAADWLATQFTKPEGQPGFFNPERGPYVYAPGTRPKSDNGVATFAGQWAGPLALLGKAWGDEGYLAAADRVEGIFLTDKEQTFDSVWTIGPTPFYTAMMYKASVMGISEEARARVERYVRGRAEYLLNPRPGAKRGDSGILSWDAYANMVAANLFDRDHHESAAKALLDQINAKLEEKFWAFNCAAEGDAVSGGQARPFGHGIAAAANALAYKRFGEVKYLHAAERFGNLLLAMHYITYNDSESPDLDTRGWANGSTGGRDQYCHLPPWETGMGLQQIGQLVEIGKARPGHYDVLWMFSRTGLAQFPKARTLKRLYTPDLRPVYRPIDSLPTERALYRSLPYMAYEEPWDQTMLAAYQGVEPVVQSLYFGGGLVEAVDHRILALAPGAATYDPGLPDRFEIHLWNPTLAPIETAFTVTTAARRKAMYSYSGAASGTGWGDEKTGSVSVPSRKAIVLEFRVGDGSAM